MSTSPEAKQAAERLLNCAAYSHLRRSEKEVAYVAGHFQQAIDAATAKFELELQRANAKCAEQAAATAKLRGELEQERKSSRQALDMGALVEQELYDKLANQQPSAPAPEGKEGDDLCSTAPVTSRSSGAPKGSIPTAAPTADAEKTLREWDSVPVWALDYYSCEKSPDSIKVREV